MTYRPVLISPQAFEEGRDAGAVRRTRRSAEEYSRLGKDDAAADAVMQTDPELSDRYRQRGVENAQRTYEREVAPQIANEDYQGAIETAAAHGRPNDVLAIREQLRTANEQQVAELNRQVEQQARALLGIAEMDPAQQQAAYTQWRASLPAEAQANVPEQYSEGFVRRRLREAMTIREYVADVARERNWNLAQARLSETERHNRATEANAAARAAATANRRRPYTEFASTSASYANRAAAADNTIRGLENIDWNEVWTIGTAGMGSETTRRARQAMREFINVRNRRESGAAISQGEWLSARLELFPAPGDTAAVIEQKAQARERVIRGLIAMGQGATREYFPEMFEPGADGTPSRWADMAGAGDNVDYSQSYTGEDEIPTINSQAEYDALPPGAEYYDSEGNYAVKP